MTVFQETVKAVKAEYPKFSNACLSLSMRSYETGVQMTPRAQKLADCVQGSERLCKAHSDRRRKSIGFRCRLSLKDAEIVKNEMSVRGFATVQELLEHLLMEWVKENRPPVDQTEERCNGGNVCTNPASEISTKDKGGQL